MRPAVLRLLALAAATLLLAAKPSRSRFAGGVFFPEELVAKINAGKFDPFEVHTGVMNVRFEADGRLDLDLGLEQSKCRYKPSAGELLILQCEGSSEPRTVRWTWLGGDRARTDLFSGDRILARSAHDLPTLIRDYDRKFEEKTRPVLSGEWKGADGTKLEIPSRGSAKLGGEKRWLAIVDCIDTTEDAPEPRTRCLILSVPGRRPNKWPAPDDAGMLLLTQRGQTLVESVFPGLNPAGLAYEPLAGGRSFTRTTSVAR
jgi:hypothetical protein